MKDRKTPQEQKEELIRKEMELDEDIGEITEHEHDDSAKGDYTQGSYDLVQDGHIIS